MHLLSLISVIMNLKSPANSSVLHINYSRSEKLLSCLVYIDQLLNHHFITEGVGFSCLKYIYIYLIQANMYQNTRDRAQTVDTNFI